jgi:NAD(P)-dependent dehydrogenase (short-subunit alcohol dehydrogenase family)
VPRCLSFLVRPPTHSQPQRPSREAGLTYPVDFSNSTVIVTGGNRGIGRAISETLAKAGANVAIIYNSAKDAPDVAAEIAKQFNIKCEAWKCDVGNPEIVKKTFQEINEKFGQVTGLVANAGVSVVKDALEMTKEDFSFVCKFRIPFRALSQRLSTGLR